MSSLSVYVLVTIVALFAIYTLGSIVTTVLVNKRLELLARALESLHNATLEQKTLRTYTKKRKR